MPRPSPGIRGKRPDRPPPRGEDAPAQPRERGLRGDSHQDPLEPLEQRLEAPPRPDSLPGRVGGVSTPKGDRAPPRGDQVVSETDPATLGGEEDLLLLPLITFDVASPLNAQWRGGLHMEEISRAPG